MKKILLSIFSLAVIAGASAQSGTVLVGGNVGFNSTTYKDENGDKENMNSFEFSPVVGYQFNDNWTAGVVGSVNTTKNSIPFSLYGEQFASLPGTVFEKDVNTTTLGVGPFVRYTQPLNDIFSVFGQLQGQYKNLKATDDGSDVEEIAQNGFHAGFFPAVFINVNNGFGLNFNFGGVEYQSMKMKQSKEVTSNFNVTFGRTFGVGVSKNF